ncbi:MAG: glycosyltransferase, partial [Flavobacteriales bacterium]|nr:glycosyltransferase [Flavobacteriales bacterium]
MELTLIIIYGCFLSFILLYSIVQLSLTVTYKRNSKQSSSNQEPATEEWPSVTVQLPVYNELYVIERLIDSVAALEYPADKLEIQVLDDGNDESVEVAAKCIAKWQKEGLNIKHVRRPERVGYKAGALAYGLQFTQGEYTAIFDADFVPRKDFLLRTMPYFIDPSIGVVQTRWEHLNEDYSVLTRLQAFGLDAHFTVEQRGRNAGGHFINFNGTAGVWRNACIEDAGGW